MRRTPQKPQEACMETLCERQGKTMYGNCVTIRLCSGQKAYLFGIPSVSYAETR